MKRFYVYSYLRARSSPHGEAGTPYYIGKGTGSRCFSRFKGEVRPSDRSLVKIIAEDLSEPDAFQLEMLLIQLYGRIDLGTGCLRNQTDGGEGTSGTKQSSETKLKHSVALRKTWGDPVWKANFLKKMKGKRHTEQGDWHHSTESRQKIKDGNLGKKHKQHMWSTPEKSLGCFVKGNAPWNKGIHTGLSPPKDE